MNRRRLYRPALLTFTLLLLLAGAVGLWVRSQQRQYALNRQLIAFLVKNDVGQALRLVNRGADPNTHYLPTPMPSFIQLFNQLRRRSTLSVNDSPTAFSIACGEAWKDDDATIRAQESRPDAPQLVQAMLRHGANINSQDTDGETPLIWAVSCDRCNTVHLLLEHNADVNVINVDGEPLLMSAIANPKIMHLLLAYGAKVNMKDKFGNTALYEAVLNVETPAIHSTLRDTIQEMLAYGADPNLPNNGGYSAVKLAQDRKRSDLMALLRHSRK